MGKFVLHCVVKSRHFFSLRFLPAREMRGGLLAWPDSLKRLWDTARLGRLGRDKAWLSPPGTCSRAHV